jgi:hypothetical protein
MSEQNSEGSEMLNVRTTGRSPVIIVAVLSLVAALAGTAIAGPNASPSAPSKKKVKKIADKEINRLAPQLSVATAEAAESANRAAIAESANRAATADDAASLGGDPASAYAKRVPGPVHRVDTPGEPAFQGTWVNELEGFEPAGFYKDGFGFVHLVGDVHPGANGSTIFTLPAGFRPTFGVDYAVRANADNSNATVVVESDGDLKAFGVTDLNNRVSLNGITFRVP